MDLSTFQWKTKTEIRGDSVRSVILLSEDKPDIKCKFCIFMFGEDNKAIKITETTWGRDFEFEYEGLEPGAYRVLTVLRSTDGQTAKKRSHKLRVVDPAVLGKFYRQVSDSKYMQGIEFHIPEFWHQHYPERDWAVISYKERTFGGYFKKYAQAPLAHRLKSEYGCYLQKLQGKGIVTSYLVTGDDRYEDDPRIVFSGRGQIGGRFVNGQDKLPDTLPDELGECVGSFTYVRMNGKRIEISHDYFGIRQLYYFDNGRVFIASNRYHLLLGIMQIMAIKAEFDTRLAASRLYAYGPFFAQNYTHDMDIKGCRILPLDRTIVIDDMGWHFAEKKIRENLAPAYDEKEYLSLLDQAAEEIKEMAREVLYSDEYESFVVDISGGLDSRLTLAALTNFPEKMDMMQARTLQQPNSRDLEIGIGLANLTGLEYKPLYNNGEMYVSPEEHINSYRSYQLGTAEQFLAGPTSCRGKNSHQLRFAGYLGEYFRVYWTTRRMEIYKDIKTDEEMAEEYVNYLLAGLCSSDELKEIVCEHLLRELRQIPGQTPVDKMENHYMYFRGRSMFGNKSVADYTNMGSYYVMGSKAFLRAAKMLPAVKRNNAVVYEVNERLNAPMLWAEYDSEYDNACLRDHLDSLHFVNKELVGSHTPLDFDDSGWKAARVNPMAGKGKNPYLEERKELNEKMYKRLQKTIDLLRQKNPEMFELVGEMLIQNAYDNKDRPDTINRLYRKLDSFLIQMAMFEK